MAKETHKQSHDRLYHYLKAQNWTVSSPLLKYRWAERNGYRVWFKSQAIYSSMGVTSLNDSRSLLSDIRGLDSEALFQLIEADRARLE